MNWIFGLSATEAAGILLGVIVVAIIEPETTEGMALWFILSLLLINALVGGVWLICRRRQP